MAITTYPTTATGSVTSVSSANGAATVATGTTTPVITIVSAPAVSSVNEATDTTCYPLFISAAGTQTLQPLNNAGLVYNSNTNALTATTFVGALTGLASLAAALKSASTTVDVSAATAPSTGQVLTATDSTHATWQAAGGGTPGVSGMVLLSSTTVDLNEGTQAQQPLYTVPTSRRCKITEVTIEKISGTGTVTTGSYLIGWDASTNGVAAYTPNGTSFSLPVNQCVLLSTCNVFESVNAPFPSTPTIGVSIGTAGQILGFTANTPRGSAATAKVDIFGYLTNTSGVPQNNIIVP